jgi:hypothetical protein
MVDVGSVPDWLAAAGGFLSIAATGYIAVTERRRAIDLEKAQEADETSRELAILSEAERLGNSALAVFSEDAKRERIRNPILDDYAEVRSSLTAVKRQLDSLRSFPMNNPRLFVAVGALADACDVDQRLRQYGLTTSADLRIRMTREIRSEVEKLKAIRP